MATCENAVPQPMVRVPINPVTRHRRSGAETVLLQEAYDTHRARRTRNRGGLRSLQLANAGIGPHLSVSFATLVIKEISNARASDGKTAKRGKLPIASAAVPDGDTRHGTYKEMAQYFFVEAMQVFVISGTQMDGVPDRPEGSVAAQLSETARALRDGAPLRLAIARGRGY